MLIIATRPQASQRLVCLRRASFSPSDTQLLTPYAAGSTIDIRHGMTNAVEEVDPNRLVSPDQVSAGGPLKHEGRALEVLAAFLKLGCSSFGGPIAHLGYIRAELVERRRWFDDRTYAELVGLCQFLPGPASSQLGFALGLMRAGPLGGFAAWAGFTLSSVGLMVGFAIGPDRLAATIAKPTISRADGRVKPAQAAKPPRGPARINPSAKPSWLEVGPGKN